MTIEPDHDHALSYHPLVPGRGELHEQLREAAKAFAGVVDRICPRSREHSLAFTAIQDSLMWANAAVAIHQERIVDLPQIDRRSRVGDAGPVDYPLAMLCAVAAGREFTLELLADPAEWEAAFVHNTGRVLTTRFGVASEVEATLGQLLGHDPRAGTYQGEPAGAGEEIEIPYVQTTGDAVEKLTGRRPSGKSETGAEEARQAMLDGDEE